MKKRRIMMSGTISELRRGGSFGRGCKIEFVSMNDDEAFVLNRAMMQRSESVTVIVEIDEEDKCPTCKQVLP